MNRVHTASRLRLQDAPLAVKSPQIRDKPVLLVDVDGVISLFGFALDGCPAGTWHNVEGIAHFLSSTAAGHLLTLDEWFDPVWCSGWEERADEHLPALLGVPRYAHLSFEREVGGRDGTARAHWKLAAIDAHAGERPLAWVDDALDDACEPGRPRAPRRRCSCEPTPPPG